MDKNQFYKLYMKLNANTTKNNSLRKITCITCNSEIYLGNYSSHRKTKKHMDNSVKTQELFYEIGDDVTKE